MNYRPSNAPHLPCGLTLPCMRSLRVSVTFMPPSPKSCSQFILAWASDVGRRMKEARWRRCALRAKWVLSCPLHSCVRYIEQKYTQGRRIKCTSCHIYHTPCIYSSPLCALCAGLVVAHVTRKQASPPVPHRPLHQPISLCTGGVGNGKSCQLSTHVVLS